ncbi:MAG TPA: KH domain-containing protein [Patescibacteria group bacterium]|nr:KH domain-containing protein [Patescibacteria group bacterium]
MVTLVKFLVTSLANQPDAVEVESLKNDPEGELITISVDQNDMGRIIGRGGKIISAIRELVKVKAIKAGKRVKVILKDPLQTDQSYPLKPSELSPQS